MASGNRDPLHFSNALWYPDRMSVGADLSRLAEPAEGAGYLDGQFGNSWSWTPPEGAAVYGRTSKVPRGPFDDGTREVLRVPFRRVPVIELTSLDEALAFGQSNASHDPNITGMWRGQSCHHRLARDPIEVRRLYGDEPVDEPSLPPSAVRKEVYFPDIAETWSGLLDLYVEERLQDLCASYPSKADNLREQAASFRASYKYRTWAFATAQHYGLPSVGLDLTSDIRIALYFALHRFTTDPVSRVLTVTRATEDDDPILYGLGVFDYDLLVDEKAAPPWLVCKRPQAQKAHFFCTSWGDSINRAADRIYVAARLKGHINWRSPISTKDVFPSVLDDRFLAFLLHAKDQFKAIEPVSSLLAQIYYR